MSDLQLSREQRQRLVHGDYSPLDFEVKPYELEPGARYVLLWAWGQPVWEPGYGMRVPKVPVKYLTVTKVVRHRKGFWRAVFDVTDLRDKDVFLRRGGGDSSVDELKAGAKPKWTPQMVQRAKAVAEFDHQRRLAKHAEERRERGRDRIRRAA